MTEATEAATPYGGSLAVGSEIEARTPSELFWRRLRGDRLAMGAVAFLIGLILMAIFAPLVVDALGLPDPNTRDPSARDIFHSFARRVMYVPFPSGANAYPSRL